MDAESLLTEALRLFERLDIAIRRAHLGGDGGGLCRLGDRRMVFLDLDVDVQTQLSRCLSALAALPQIDDVFVSPALRVLIDKSDP